MTVTQTCPDDLLNEVYEKLEFETASGFYRISEPHISLKLDQYFWFEQARNLDAEAILFVNDHPTVLFFKYDNFGTNVAEYEENIRQKFLKVWNSSRVPLFFFALPGEIRVYSAYQKPLKENEWNVEKRFLKHVKNINKVLELYEFSRPEIESGQLFFKRKKDFNTENRVDQWLLKNLQLLRRELGGTDPQKREYVHALIGRSIFIRYLEDREILVDDYFSDLNINNNKLYKEYIDVLTNKNDTYLLFDKLRKDFNGDLFPLNDNEKEIIQEKDLHLLSNFLSGKTMNSQSDLFFWAYNFKIIPIELISNIYEEFYHENDDNDDKGTHYTPSTLVEFVLSECLTVERLDANVKILDPACGSGIFLVEAFNRIVYHEYEKRGVKELPPEELKNILTDRIVGIDINESAVKVAAFSLYLALLNFLKPPDIRKYKLPYLIYNPQRSESGKSLFVSDIFHLTSDEQTEIQHKLQKSKRYLGRSKDLRIIKESHLPVDNNHFDVIVGNPPWGADKSSQQLAVEWCRSFGYTIGYKELSQCFMARVRNLVKQNGEIGLLVSTGVFFKHHKNSRKFREEWLKNNHIRAVFNFAHVRDVFFRKQRKDSIAPFAAVFFTPQKTAENLENVINYVTIKHSSFIDQLQAVIIHKTDMRKARQCDFMANDWLWKTYMWGGFKDVDLICELKSFNSKLQDYVDKSNYGRGFGDIPGNHTISDLSVRYELPDDRFRINLPFSELIVPIKHRSIRRIGNLNLYKGNRIIIKRGISRGEFKIGEINPRLTNEQFAFTDNFIGFSVDDIDDSQRIILLGIILSSLTKYYHFLTCSAWGFWHYAIHTKEHLQLPIRFPKDQKIKNRIISAVQKITSNKNLFNFSITGRQEIQDELDNSIYDLYELSNEQRDLVRDLCDVTIEYFYNGTESKAIKHPKVNNLEEYRDAFLDIWKERLRIKGKELESTIYAPLNGLLCGLSFELKDLGTADFHNPITSDNEWKYWFRQLSIKLRKEYTTGIYIDRIVKELSDNSIFIIKRAERRLWTKSQARQDAQELLTEVFKLEWKHNGSLV